MDSFLLNFAASALDFGAISLTLVETIELLTGPEGGNETQFVNSLEQLYKKYPVYSQIKTHMFPILRLLYKEIHSIPLTGDESKKLAGFVRGAPKIKTLIERFRVPVKKRKATHQTVHILKRRATSSVYEDSDHEESNNKETRTFKTTEKTSSAR